MQIKTSDERNAPLQINTIKCKDFIKGPSIIFSHPQDFSNDISNYYNDSNSFMWKIMKQIHSTKVFL